MTSSETDSASLVELRKRSPHGMQSFYGAKIGLRVVSILNRARDAAGLKNSELAERLGVSEGRVSQVMNGDGNLHLATVGRFLAACGYEGELVAKPLTPNLPELRKVSRVRRRESAAAKTWDFFEQSFVNETGVTAHLAAVPRVGTGVDSCSIPVGAPKLVGTFAGTPVQHARLMVACTASNFGLDLDNWVERINEAAVAEDPVEAATP